MGTKEAIEKLKKVTEEVIEEHKRGKRNTDEKMLRILERVKRGPERNQQDDER